jgi:hypothetical protein
LKLAQPQSQRQSVACARSNCGKSRFPSGLPFSSKNRSRVLSSIVVARFIA